MQPHRLTLVLLAVLPLAAPAGATSPARTLWTSPSGATVYAAPVLSAPILAQIPDNQPVRVVPAGPSWGRTLLWNSVPAWIPLTGGLLAHPVVYAPSRYVPSTLRSYGPHAPMALSARGIIREPAYLRAVPAFSAARVRLLRAGTAVSLDAWATDAGGAAWYHTAGTAGPGWVWGDAVTFDRRRRANAAALLAPLRGKGMWFTYALLANSPAGAIVAAARAAGLTHLYVEVGRSNGGFYGATGLVALLPAAHRAGIRVIAWVYPYLEDLPADVLMSMAAARYVAPSGDRPDGLLADVEENMAEGTVRAYGQVLRAMLGPDQLMAVATYPPQSGPGATYPFATVALSWDAIVPMDYWHLRRRAYNAGEAYQYVRDSVRMIRAQTNAGEPVEVLGQMFDPFESGVNYPGATEITACAAAARDAGALGVSFFEWNHATAEEWAALAALPAATSSPR